jgi:uncharacterized protein YidB (DUF937 family)
MAVTAIVPTKKCVGDRFSVRRIKMASSRMTALLALLAVAGYQNRDRLGEMLSRVTGQRPSDGSGGANPRAGVESPNVGGLGGLLGGLLGGSSGGIAGGLGELIQNMTGSGHGEVAKSWVQTGPNQELNTTQLADALGSDAIEQLTSQTGLSRDELLSRLKSVLPTAVDKLTPDGRLPTDAETSQWKA